MDLTGLLQWLGSSIGSQLSTLAEWAQTAIATLWNNLNGVWSAILDLASWVYNLLGEVWAWIQNLWDWLKNHIIGPLIAWLRQWHARLVAFLKPLIDCINKLRKLYAWYWQNILKPVIDKIQRLRQFLVIFRLLGFKWAQQLDSYLVKMEQTIQRNLLAVGANLNILSQWVNFILDPLGNLQPSLLVGSVFKSIGAIWGIIWDKQNVPLVASDAAAQSRDAHQFDRSQVLQSMHAHAAAGVQPEDTSDLAGIQTEWADMGIV